MRSNIFFKFVIFLCLISCSKQQPSIEPPARPYIIPVPSDYGLQKGAFLLNEKVSLYSDSELNTTATILNDYLKEKLDYRLVTKSSSDKNSISFIHDKTIESDEGYELVVDSTKVTIKAKTAKGAFYGFQTLRQFFPPTVENKTFPNKEIQLQNAFVKDAPRFPYRGMHLDVSRHFYSVDFIKKYIDLLSQLKMNTFHWHLTDDQGWRIEIKQYPELQKVAAFRDETLIGHYNDTPHQFDGKKYGGFYTQEEVKDIVN